MIAQDRREAGSKLAAKMEANGASVDHVYAIASGGVVVGREIAEGLGAIIRLMSIEDMIAPDDPETIIGSVTHDGTLAIKDEVVRELGISPGYISQARISLMKDAQRFFKLYSEKEIENSLSGKTVAVVDDGSADYSGLISSVGHLKKKGAKKIYVVVPFMSQDAFRKVQTVADSVFVLEKDDLDISVAELYENFDWVSEKDLKRCVSG